VSEEKHATLRVLDALQMKGFDGKREYVASLEARGDEQAVSLLVECLCDESSFLRELAERALTRMGEEHAPLLRPLLTQGLWYTRASVARVLGGVGAKEALPDLVTLLTDANGAIAEAAAEAIVAIARDGSLVSVARALHAAPDRLQRHLTRQAESASPGLGAQIERLLGDRELMVAEDEEVLREDAEALAAQDNVEWEVLTTPRRRRRTGTPRATAKQAPSEPADSAPSADPPDSAESTEDETPPSQ
jgi:HEAT repeat protein